MRKCFRLKNREPVASDEWEGENQNFAAIGAPSIACIFLLAGISDLSSILTRPIWLTGVAATLDLSCPLSNWAITDQIPHFVYADWYAKRARAVG